MISFKVQTYLYDLLQYLNINKKENYNLIKKFQEIIPFLQYLAKKDVQLCMSVECRM